MYKIEPFQFSFENCRICGHPPRGKRFPKKSIPTNDRAGISGISHAFCKNQFPSLVIPNGIEVTDEVVAANKSIITLALHRINSGKVYITTIAIKQ